MSTLKEQALQLRLQGRSYGEINQLLSIPKSTLSHWLSNVQLSDDARNKINQRSFRLSTTALIKRNRAQTHTALKRMFEIRKQSRITISKLNNHDLLLIGTALYWAEGYKRLQIKKGKTITQHAVSLTNSDPLLIKIFIRFLKEVCGVADKDIKAEIRIFPHMHEPTIRQWWQKTINLPKENFTKTIIVHSKSSMNKRPFNRLEYGTILIRVHNTRLFHTIMGWIEGLGSID